MTYKVDFIDGAVLRWSLTADGVAVERDSEYTPTIYAGVRDGSRAKLEALHEALAADPKVVDIEWEHWLTTLGADEPEAVLRIDLEGIDDVRQLVREVRTLHEAERYAPGTFELYNTDFSPQFRYCLETGIDPTPEYRLSVFWLDLSEKGLVDRDLSQLRLDDEPVTGNDRDMLETVQDRLDAIDPDVLVLSRGGIVPFLSDRAADLGFDEFQLGRLPGYQQLAGDSEMQTYGQILHSPARYNVPGRAIINRSNSFMWSKSGL